MKCFNTLVILLPLVFSFACQPLDNSTIEDQLDITTQPDQTRKVDPSILTGVWQSDCIQTHNLILGETVQYSLYRYTFSENNAFKYEIKQHDLSGCTGQSSWRLYRNNPAPTDTWQETGKVMTAGGIEAMRIEIATHYGSSYTTYEDFLVILNNDFLYIAPADLGEVNFNKAFSKISD